MSEQLYYYAFGKPPQPWLHKIREGFYKRICRVLVRGKMNTALIQFIDNGQRVTCSRNVVRKVKHESN